MIDRMRSYEDNVVPLQYTQTQTQSQATTPFNFLVMTHLASQQPDPQLTWLFFHPKVCMLNTLANKHTSTKGSQTGTWLGFTATTDEGISH